MAFGYGHPTVDSAEAVLTTGGGAVVGVGQAAALDLADTQGMLGTPLITGIKNSQLADFAIGGATAAVGAAGAFGKGPTKKHTGASLFLTGYGIGQIAIGALLNLTGSALSARGGAARGAPASGNRWGGGMRAGGAGAVLPPSGNQRVINELSY